MNFHNSISEVESEIEYETLSQKFESGSAIREVVSVKLSLEVGSGRVVREV